MSRRMSRNSSTEENEGVPFDRDNKGEYVQFGCSTEPFKVSDYGLQQELAASYYWTGNCGADYMFFVANWHPLLGICCSHPAHPWSKCERLITFLISIGLTSLPIAIVAVIASKDSLYGLVSNIGLFVFITLPLLIVESLFYVLAIIDVPVEKTRATRSEDGHRISVWCLACCANCIRCGKQCCYCIVGMVSLIVFLLSVLIISQSDLCQEIQKANLGGTIANAVESGSLTAMESGQQMFFKNTTIPIPAEWHNCDGISGVLYLLFTLTWKTRLMSWVTWFPVWTFMPCGLGFLSGWCAEANQANQEGYTSQEDDVSSDQE